MGRKLAHKEEITEATLRYAKIAQKAVLSERHCNAMNRSTGRERDDIFNDFEKPEQDKAAEEHEK